MRGIFIALVALYVLLSVLLIIVVLIQQRTKGGMASVLGGGGGGAEQIFGSSGVAPILTRVTAILGAAFMVFSLLLVLLSGSSGGTQRTRTPVQPQGTATQPSQAPIPSPAGQGAQPVQGQSGGR